MSTPPADVRARLADAWEATAYHEAGHAVVALHHGWTIKFVRLEYNEHKPWFGAPGWSVDGFTRCLTPEGDSTEAGALFYLAGIEAEARWLAKRKGDFHFSARSTVRGNPTLREGDLREFRRLKSGIARSVAQRRALEIVRAHWPLVGRIAAGLIGGGDRVLLSGGAIARLVD